MKRQLLHIILAIGFAWLAFLLITVARALRPAGGTAGCRGVRPRHAVQARAWNSSRLARDL